MDKNKIYAHFMSAKDISTMYGGRTLLFLFNFLYLINLGQYYCFEIL